MKWMMSRAGTLRWGISGSPELCHGHEGGAIIGGMRSRLLAAFVGVLACAGAACADAARMHNTAGMAFVYGGKDREAFNEFVLSLKVDPNQAQPNFQIARIFEKQGKYEEA